VNPSGLGFLLELHEPLRTLEWWVIWGLIWSGMICHVVFWWWLFQ
jgi:hypothetical protein